MRRFLFVILLGAGACAPRVIATPPQAGADATPPRDLHWVRTAAEYRALFIQTYRYATDRLYQEAAARPAGGWAVILDGDETVLDNSEYQRRLFQRGERFDIDTWNAWVREAAADSLPGAAAFIRSARELGGRVIMVTNREEVVCDATRDNLRRLGMHFDAVLCQQPGERGKNGRLQAVPAGTTSAGLPPLAVIMYIGDNIQDFPDATQDLRTAPPAQLDRIGRSWFILPNPMYGSWERNPPR